MRKYEQVVKNGIAYLDNRHPEGWRDKIKKDILSMGSCSLCIMGQLHGDFIRGLRTENVEYSGEDASLGFALPHTLPHTIPWSGALLEYDELTKEWIRQLVGK